MTDIPITLTNTINVTSHCTECGQELEASIIIDSDYNQIIVTIDPGHQCPVKIIKHKTPIISD